MMTMIMMIIMMMTIMMVIMMIFMMMPMIAKTIILMVTMMMGHLAHKYSHILLCLNSMFSSKLPNFSKLGCYKEIK